MKPLNADKLWRNNQHFVAIIAFMLQQVIPQCCKVIWITVLYQLKGEKTQVKYVYQAQIKPDILPILIPNPAWTRNR